MKLTPNIDEAVQRSKLNETYLQILTDLLEAKDLLPAEISYTYRNRPNKPAALAQLARVYLSMGQYDNAGLYSDSCLQLYHELIDYTSIKDLNAPRPFDKYNIETMYQSKFVTTNVLIGAPICFVDSTLFKTYALNDLRRSFFFTPFSNNRYYFKGSYTGTAFPFTGLATDEMFLVRAECRARAENVSGAMEDINYLLQRRLKAGTFMPL
jgi:hypothetical protein